MRAKSLLALIARIRPEAWDAIIPHTPSTAGARVALNPQPLPPGEAFVVDAARMAHDIVRLAVEAGARGESTGFVSEFIDDWCGTPWPHKWPWPWPGPTGDPDPNPDLIGLARTAGAVVFAAAGARLPNDDLGATLAAGAEQLAKAALG